tara:strand:+ start:259 stop:570 length:312 start_codon:yes stop_codon:yes gene_type:complete
MSVKPPGSDWDVRGCIASAGYLWCELLGRCVRSWETPCEIPYNCLTWNDGCNICGVENGKLTLCSEMACFAQGDPFCAVWAPEPIIDYPMPMPPFTINLGDGH